MGSKRALFTSEGQYPEASDKVDEELRKFFSDYTYKGVFIDIGAYHSEWSSSSWHFEMSGWIVICIEANPACIEELKKNRKNVLHYAAYSENCEKTLLVFTSPQGAANVGHQASYTGLNGFAEGPSRPKRIKVRAKTLDWILSKHFPSLEFIDILSIDVEGSEMEVLKGFDLEKWLPKVIVIENRGNDKEKFSRILKPLGYSCYKQKYRPYNEFHYLTKEFGKRE